MSLQAHCFLAALLPESSILADPCSQGDRSGDRKLRLYAVLSHTGGVSSGHYYAHICVHGDKWLMFDDHRVEQVSEEQVSVLHRMVCVVM